MSYSERVAPARRIQDLDILEDIIEAEHHHRARLDASGEAALFELRLFENQRKPSWGNGATHAMESGK